MNIQIKPLEMKHLDIAVQLAVHNYFLERTKNNALSEKVNESYFSNSIKDLISCGIGNIALENDEVVGFLAFNAQLGSDYSESPLYGYGIKHTKRSEVISKLLKNTLSILCENNYQYFNISVYAHDREVLWTYIMSAFTMGVTDVVRDTNTSVNAKAVNFIFKELNKVELIKHYRFDVIEIYRNLINHLRASPIFYPCNEFMPIEDRSDDFLSDNIRVFAVLDGDKLVGMVCAEPPDKNFTVEDLQAVNMTDLFVIPDYRRHGIAAALLEFANNELRKSDTERIFVTHGTVNPTARGFWGSYFTNYSYTLSRQINHNMLGKIDLI